MAQQWSLLSRESSIVEREIGMFSNFSHIAANVQSRLSQLAEQVTAELDGSVGYDGGAAAADAEAYKAQLVEFQIEQAKLSREFHSLLKDTVGELEKWKALYQEKHGVEEFAVVQASMAEANKEAGVRLEKDVRRLEESNAQWESKVTLVLGENAELVAALRRRDGLINELQLRLESLERVELARDRDRKLQQATIDDLVQSHSKATSEAVDQKEVDDVAARSLARENEELRGKVVACEANILKLLEAGAENVNIAGNAEMKAELQRGMEQEYAAKLDLHIATLAKERDAKESELLATLEKNRDAERESALQAKHAEYMAALDALKIERGESLDLLTKAKDAERLEALATLSKERDEKEAQALAQLAKVKDEEREHALQASDSEHLKVLASLSKERDAKEGEALLRLSEDKESEYAVSLEALRQAMENEQETKIAAALGTLTMEKDTEREVAVQTLAAGHLAAITALTQESDARNTEHAAALTERDAKHEAALREKDAQHAAAMEEQRMQHAIALKEKDEEREAAVESIVEAMQEELMNLAAQKDQIKDELTHAETRWETKQEAALAKQALAFEAKVAAAKELYLKENKRRKAIHNRLMDVAGNIRVIARVRPVLEVEGKNGQGDVVTSFPSEEDVEVKRDESTTNRFEFDRVFTPASTQEEVFEGVKPLIMSTMDGHNLTIFAYGQTGSGKTFTMEGPIENPGVNTRALATLFEIRDARAEDVSYSFHIEMLEIYNETVLDLLAEEQPADVVTGSPTRTQRKSLEIRQSATEGSIVPGLTTVAVATMDEVLKVLERGKRNRAVGVHAMNEHSSRSHMIFTVSVTGTDNHTDAVTRAKLNLIDLAGSERLSKTDATGDRLVEAKNINKSLSALGDVIAALVSYKGGKSGHVPFRNSKLTFLLQGALSGSSKVMMFVNVSPAAYNSTETITSLGFGQRCRSVELGQSKKNSESAEMAKMRKLAQSLEAQIREAGLEPTEKVTPSKPCSSPPSSASTTPVTTTRRKSQS